MMNQTHDRKGERGSALVLAAISMFTLILIAGLAVDISHFYLVKTELQNGADAAALAGASGLNFRDTGIDDAMSRAVRALNANKYEFNNQQFISGSDLTDLEDFVKFGTLEDYENDTITKNKFDAKAVASEIQFVKVTTPNNEGLNVTVPIFFASVSSAIGNSRTLEAEAVAGTSVPLNAPCDFSPFSVIECDDPAAPGCKLGATDKKGVYTPVKMSDGVTNCPSQTEFTQGCVYVVKTSGGGTEGPAPGNYQLLAVSGPGGSDVRVAAGGAVDYCDEDGCIRTKTGSVSGPVWQGLNTRFGEYGAGLSPQSFPPDTNISEGTGALGLTYDQYVRRIGAVEPSGEGRPYMTEGRRSDLLVPIIKKSQYIDPVTGKAKTGTISVCPSGLGRFFLQKKVPNGSGDITLEYIDSVVLGGRGGYIEGGGVGNPNFRVPVLYK